MCSRYLGFILLVWFPGALHAQSAAWPCPAPSLVHGYFVPVKETYSHDFKLTYACRNTHKPAVQGWWAESVCQNGTWSHTPRCIDENACIAPTIANAKYTEASEGWYEEGHIIRITCDKGYEHKDNIAIARCRDGTWSSLPTCEISINSCRAPRKDPHAVIIDQGYQEMFPEDAEVKYECEDGYSIEGSHNYTLYCLAGTWTEGPMCNENACIAPTIANAKYTEASEGWYEQGHIIRITCDKGYEHKDNMATARCRDGTWSSLPSCEISINSCRAPRKDPHAVIVYQGYQELFPEDAEVKYECEDGYSIEGSHNYTRICLAGIWTEGPMCSKDTGRGGGHGGSAEAGTSGGDSTSSGRVTQPVGGDKRPDIGHGGSADAGTSGGDSTSSGRGTQPVGGGGGGSRPDIGHGGSVEVGPGGGHSTSSGPGTQPGSGGSSSTSANRPLFISINNCGTRPIVPNGVVVEEGLMYLKFQCQAFYKQVGEETVVCFNDGSWSKVPVCEDAFCVLEPGNYVTGFEVSVATYINEGETKYIPCTWPDYSVAVHCSNRRITHTRCCHRYDHNRGVCT